MRKDTRPSRCVRRPPRFNAILIAILAMTPAMPASAGPPVTAADATGHIVHGSDTTTMSSPGYGKPNQTRLWFNSHQGGWDALLPKNDGDVSASDHYIMKDVAGNQLFTPVELEDRNSGRPDVFWDDAHKLLYVLGSHKKLTKIWKVHYDDAADQYHIDPAADGVTVDGIAHGSANRPAALYVTPNGSLWAAVMTSRGLEVQHSRDGGSSWMPTPINLDAMASTGVVTWSHFVDGNATYAGVFAGENAGTQSVTLFHFWFIAQDADPSDSASWIEDSPDLPLGDGVADDHVAAARDAGGNLYFVAKTQGGHGSDPLIVLYRRTPAGLWSLYPVTLASEEPEQSRPSLGVDEDQAELYVFTTDTGGGIGRYKKAHLRSLDDLASAPLQPVFSSAGKTFSDLMTPRHPAHTRTGLAVLAHNTTDMTMWWNDPLGRSAPPDPPAPQGDPPACGTADAAPCEDDASACGVVPGKWRFKNAEIKWSLKNESAVPATIERIVITWPEDLKELKEIKLKSKLTHKKIAPPSATLASFRGKDRDRRLDPGKKKDIKFKFQHTAHGHGRGHKGKKAEPDVYIRIDFREGCAVEWGTEPLPDRRRAGHDDDDDDGGGDDDDRDGDDDDDDGRGGDD